jgi:transposase
MGELVAIRVPSEAEEGVRDLVRAREDLVIDRRRSRQRLSAFLLRHGQVFRDGDAWTNKHLEWLTSRRFEDAAVQATYDRYRAVTTVRDADVAAIDADLAPWFDHELFHERSSRLAAYRGIADEPKRIASLDQELAELARRQSDGDGAMDWEYLLVTARKNSSL